MEPGPFRLVADPAHRLIAIDFMGSFWTPAVADRFRAECLAAVARFDCPPGEHLFLVDLRNATLQSQAVIEKMKELVGIATARRIALVAEAPLARMQTKRLQVRDNVVLFACVEEARAWLFELAVRAAA